MTRSRSRTADGPIPDQSAIDELRPALLGWYRRDRRDLPWRRTRDPYAIWVSEIMLQQTQVATVLPYYERFLERFPDVPSLAAASEEEVLSAWSGLGYYRRARALHAAARVVVQQHDGKLPRDPAALRELPGVGRYTAGAIASIAFDLPEAILDGNVRRVLSRLFAVDGTLLGASAEERNCWRIAERLADGPAPGDLNQALMELGALVCTPTGPRCLLCPARAFCRAFAAGDPERIPASKPTRAAERVRVAVAWIARGERLLLERPSEVSPLRGTWDLPATEIGFGDDASASLARHIAERHGLEIDVGDRVGRHSHGIMHRRLTLEVHACRVRRGRTTGSKDLRWVDPGALAEVAVSGATKKIAAGVTSATRGRRSIGPVPRPGRNARR